VPARAPLQRRAIPAAAMVPWSARRTIGELLFGFFHFFSEDFRWGEEVVSVRLGRRTSVQDPIFEQLRGRAAQRLHIEDPFLHSRNLHCVLRQANEAQLRQTLREAAASLRRGVLPGGLGAAPVAGVARWAPAQPAVVRAAADADGKTTATATTAPECSSPGSGSESAGSGHPAAEDLPATLLGHRWNL